MKKILISLIFLLGLLFFPSQARAADCSIALENRATIKEGDKPVFLITNTSNATQKFFIRFQPVGYGSLPRGYQICHNPSKGFDLILDPGETRRIEGRSLKPLRVPSVIPGVEKVTKTFKLQGFLHTNDQCGETTITGHLRCEGDDFTLQPAEEKEGICKIITDKKAVKPGEPIKITLFNQHTEEINVKIEIQPPGFASKFTLPSKGPLKPGKSHTWETAIKQGGAEKADKVYIRAKPSLVSGTIYCWKSFYVTIDPEKITSLLEVFRPQSCGKCLETDSQDNCIRWSGLQTALGCIPTEIQPFVSWLFKYAISIAGGIAFLLIIFSAFQMITSSGDPEKLEKAKQMLGSAIAGLLFIIFAVFLLRIIGVEILDIF